MSDTGMIHHNLQDGIPIAIDHVIGQQHAVRQLKVALEAYHNDRSITGGQNAFPHTLLVGPPGLGKSLLANIIAKELGTCLHEEMAQNIFNPCVLHGLLMMIEHQHCVFCDEIHELNPISQTTLYRALEDRKLFLPSENGTKRRGINLPPFTMIAATTDEWLLNKPLRDRFKLVLRLTHYSVDELAQVVLQRARRLGWNITEAGAKSIATRGRGTPRIALRILEAARRTVRSEGMDSINVETLRRTFEVEGLDTIGLDRIEQQYLQILHDVQGSVRLNVVATKLSLPRQTIVMFEQDLLRLGLIVKDKGSQRLLTDEGRKHIRKSL